MYEGSCGLTYPGEFSMVTLRLGPSVHNSPWGKKPIHRKVVVRCLGGGPASDEATPRFMALVDDFRGILLILGLAGERELVLRLTIGNFVNAVGGGSVYYYWCISGRKKGKKKRTGTTRSWRARGRVDGARRPQCRSAWTRAGPARRRRGPSSRSRLRRGGP